MRASSARIAAILAAALLTALAGVLTAPGAGAERAMHGALRKASVAPNHKRTNSTSTNWSGYAVAGGRYRSVTATWTQPSVSCSGSAYSSFWIGIDGDTSGTVEQTGTSADCNGSTPVYYAWYEMYPQYPTNYPNRVSAGDHFVATVTTDGTGSFTLTLKDSTRGWTQTTTQRLNKARLASAEVIAEAPSSRSGVLPLANFGTVSFSGAKVNGNTLTASTPGIDAITMVTSGGTVKAKPSSISNGAFSVAWRHA